MDRRRYSPKQTNSKKNGSPVINNNTNRGNPSSPRYRPPVFDINHNMQKGPVLKNKQTSSRSTVNGSMASKPTHSMRGQLPKSPVHPRNESQSSLGRPIVKKKLPPRLSQNGYDYTSFKTPPPPPFIKHNAVQNNKSFQGPHTFKNGNLNGQNPVKRSPMQPPMDTGAKPKTTFVPPDPLEKSPQPDLENHDFPDLPLVQERHILKNLYGENAVIPWAANDMIPWFTNSTKAWPTNDMNNAQAPQIPFPPQNRPMPVIQQWSTNDMTPWPANNMNGPSTVPIPFSPPHAPMGHMNGNMGMPGPRPQFTPRNPNYMNGAAMGYHNNFNESAYLNRNGPGKINSPPGFPPLPQRPPFNGGMQNAQLYPPRPTEMMPPYQHYSVNGFGVPEHLPNDNRSMYEMYNIIQKIKELEAIQRYRLYLEEENMKRLLQNKASGYGGPYQNNMQFPPHGANNIPNSFERGAPPYFNRTTDTVSCSRSIETQPHNTPEFYPPIKRNY